MNIQTISDIRVDGKAVLMRVDFNVPLKDGRVVDDRRIREALPSIKRLMGQKARLILMSHLGRPAGKGYEEKYSLRPVARHLGRLLGIDVQLGPPGVVGPELDGMVRALAPGRVLLMENLRFDPAEILPDEAEDNPAGQLTAAQQEAVDRFADAIAKHGDMYVNDAFGTCHRPHVSMHAVPLAMRRKGGAAVAGFLVAKEIQVLDDALTAPRQPFVAILGGAKVSDKIKLIANLLPKVERLLIGGAMAYTPLQARGVMVGKSRVDKKSMGPIKELLEAAGDKILLPCDHVATDWFDPETLTAGNPVTIAGTAIPDDLLGMDIGARTAAAFAGAIAGAGTIIWNGPMGVSEIAAYAEGTRAVAMAIAEATGRGAVSIVGGGDSAKAVAEMGLEEQMTYVSTGGGASLKYLEGSPMPPLEILDQK